MRRLMRLIRPTGAPYPANHTHINNENYPSFSANSRRYWKIWRADFGGLFLLSLSSRYGSEYAVADDRHRATDSILQRWLHHPGRSDDRAGFPVYGTITTCWLWRFSAYPAPDGSVLRRWRSILPMSCNWRRRPSILIRWASSIAARRSASNGILSSAFSPDQQFPRQGVLAPRHHV